MQAMAATPGCECAAVLLKGAQVSTQLVALLLLLPVCYGCHPNPCMHTIWSHNTPTNSFLSFGGIPPLLAQWCFPANSIPR